MFTKLNIFLNSFTNVNINAKIKTIARVKMSRVSKLEDFEKLLEYEIIEYIDDFGQKRTKRKYAWQKDEKFMKWLLERKQEFDYTITQSYVNSKIDDVLIWQPNARRIIKDYIATLKTFIKRDLERKTKKHAK